MVAMMGDGASGGVLAPRASAALGWVTTCKSWGGLQVISKGEFPKGAHQLV